MRLPEVLNLIGVSRPTLYAWMQQDKFPRPLKLNSQVIAWYESEIREWIAGRPRALGNGDGSGARG